MPYSFTEIEEDKSRTIAFVFSFLLLFYFISFWIIAVVIHNYIQYQSLSYSDRAYFESTLLSWESTLLVLLIAFCVGIGHWFYTVSNLIPKMLAVLKAESLNKKDHYHQMFQNIIDEVSVATGGTKIEGVAVPTMAMNAFALQDFEGRSIIGITEGVLARLSRAQIEAIVGHEAAHIVSGDCLSTTVTSSLFELYSGLLRGIELLLRGSGRSRHRSGRSSGGGLALILLVYVLLSVTKGISQLVRMFISRQREFRADAIAVRLTRDPLSLAEALYGIAYHWRGQGLAAQELEAIFIVNPQYAYLDEHEGLWAELFSTHPPVKKRLSVLLDMAHANAETMIRGVEKLDNRPRLSVPEVDSDDAKWMVRKDGKWEGPFELIRLATLGWMTPETWIKRVGEDRVKMAYEDPLVTGIASQSQEDNEAHERCPRCKVGLTAINYEGVEVEKCPFCKGVLMKGADIQRIIIRQEVGFSERIKKIAQQLKKESDLFGKLKINRDPKTLFICPKCNNPRIRMHRMFYTEAYKVEIDRCFYCDSVWFDGNELEVLQCLIEGATQKSKS